MSNLPGGIHASRYGERCSLALCITCCIFVCEISQLVLADANLSDNILNGENICK